MNYYLTDVSEQCDSPGMWGFEVFTDERSFLGHFDFPNEADAALAAKEFVWLIEKISSLSAASKF